MRRLILEHALLPSGWARNVAVDVEAGVIRAVRPDAAAGDGEDIAGIALPGMPNLHSHTFQRGMAGRAESRGPGSDSFWTWRRVMYRFVDRLTPEAVEAIAAFAMMEMLEKGYTSLGEFHYLHHGPDGQPYAAAAEMSERIVAAAFATNMGLTLLPVLYSHGGFGGEAPRGGQRRFVNDVPRFLELLEGARRSAAALDDAVVGVAPHSLRAVSPDALAELLAASPDGPVHMHIAEQTLEVDDCLKWSGQRPMEWLLDHVAVDGRWCLVHATHLSEAETRRFAGTGAVAGLCPITEANLGDGIFDGARFLAAGGAFGIGSDSNIEITASGELKMLEYSQRLQHRVRNALTLQEGESSGRVLYDGALRGGARALGRRIGAIAAGHRADIVVLDADHPDLALASGDGWLDAYVFVAGAAAIRRVLVGGRTVVANGRHEQRDSIAAAFTRTMKRCLA